MQVCVRRHLFAALILASSLAAADSSVAALFFSVRDALAHHRSDSQIARAVHRVKLSERLDDRTIEALESQGAGPQTVAELMHLRDASVSLASPRAAMIEAPPALPGEEQEIVWQAARDKALNYTASLPDFICTENVQRFKDSAGKDAWRLADTLTIQLSFFGHQENYKLISMNHRATRLSYEQVGGAITEGEFGSTLSAVFSPASQTAYRWDHWTTLRGRPTHVYTFRIAVANSQYRMGFGTNAGEQRDITVGQHGYVYVDRDTNMAVRIVADADGIPSDFPMQRASTQVDYGFTDVGGRPYLLPLHAQTQFDGVPLRHRNEVSFLNYQKFTANATITYGK
jgi:hypothetical protein